MAKKATVEHLLRLLKQNLISLPPGVGIVRFMECGGKPPDDAAVDRPAAPKSRTLAEVTDDYVRAHTKSDKIEDNTLYTAKIHLAHFGRTLGERFPLEALTLRDLQRHVDRRKVKAAAVTIRKEILKLRAIWNWARRNVIIDGTFPDVRGLVYPKADEKLPFMTRAEAERRGVDPECIYLTTSEIGEFLLHVRSLLFPAWVYPAVAFAAHTGARRSEIMRAEACDVDIADGFVTIREMKRRRGARTTRRVPLTPFLAGVLADHPPPFSPGDPDAVNRAWDAATRGGPWAVLKGWHVLRHSFISACASRGIDQRFIDEWVGHQTEEQRRRYRHLYPSYQQRQS